MTTYNMVYHIYWGTSGNAGLYLDEIYQVLKNAGFKQKVFVNYYYPFDYGEKIFFKRGDVAMSKYKGKLRKLFQLYEVLLGYAKILLISQREKPALINYSHAGQSFFFVIWFLRLIKKISGAKLVITCHDVMPHSFNSKEMVNRKIIFHLADYLLVHNNNSIKELNMMFGIDFDRIVHHPFPIMDLSKLIKIDEPIEKDTDFLFIGHLRKDKGILFLLDAWKSFYAINKEATLKICGRKLQNLEFDENELCKYNIEFNLRYINDDDYYWYIKRARYVVLPYLQGTNSGIISTVLSLGTDVIASDIPMFYENSLVSKDNLFVCGSRLSLVNKLQEKWERKNTKSLFLVNEYRRAFNDSVVEVYNRLLDKMYV